MRLPVIGNISTKDGATNKNARLTNMLAEQKKSGTTLATVRPGLNKIASTTGNGNGLVCFGGELVSVYDAILGFADDSSDLESLATHDFTGEVYVGFLTQQVPSGFSVFNFGDNEVVYSSDGVNFTDFDARVAIDSDIIGVTSFDKVGSEYVVGATYFDPIPTIKHGIWTSSDLSTWDFEVSRTAATAAKCVTKIGSLYYVVTPSTIESYSSSWALQGTATISSQYGLSVLFLPNSVLSGGYCYLLSSPDSADKGIYRFSTLNDLTQLVSGSYTSLTKADASFAASGVDTTIVAYSANGGSWNTASISGLSGHTFFGLIEANGTWFLYTIDASDNRYLWIATSLSGFNASNRFALDYYGTLDAFHGIAFFSNALLVGATENEETLHAQSVSIIDANAITPLDTIQNGMYDFALIP